MKKLMFVILVLLAVLLAGCTTVSTSGSYTLERGETLGGNLLVTAGDATLEENSRVNGAVIVTSGRLDVEANAEIEGDALVTAGDVNLAHGAVVRGDVIVTAGRVSQGDGARVGGRVSTNGLDVGGWFLSACCLPPVILLVVFLYWLVSLARKYADDERVAGRTATPTMGLVLVLVGAFLLARSVFDLNVGTWRWWALLILIPVVGSLDDAWRRWRRAGRLDASVRGPLVSSAMLLLLTAIFFFGLSWSATWPLFLVIIGLGMLIAR